MTYRKIGFLLVAAGILLITIAISTHPAFRLITALPDALGFREPKKYLVLLQNNTELRPTGGFMGTFALVSIDRGKPKIEVEDIYTPDGQVKGHIDPPEPIQEAFQLGEWRLRDANWDPDFPTAARKVEWFMDKGGVPRVDGVIATNLIVFEEVLKILGPIHLPDYKEVVTAENLWLLGEQYAQDAFFPGSIQKREFFSDLAAAVLREFQDSSMRKKLTLVQSSLRMVQEKHLLFSFHDDRIQSIVESLHWSGRIREPSCPWRHPSCIPESLMIVEANLGVNKTNCCVTRSVDLELEVPGTSNKTIRHKLTLNITNRSSSELWGGRYKAWVRIYANAKDQIGFWVDVPEGESRTYQTSYEIFQNQVTMNRLIKLPFVLFVQKQSGVDQYSLTLSITRGGKTKTLEKLIKTDTRLVL